MRYTGFRTPRNAHSFFVEDFQSDALYWCNIIYCTEDQFMFRKKKLKRAIDEIINYETKGPAASIKSSISKIFPCGWVVQYIFRFPVYRMKRLKECPDDYVMGHNLRYIQSTITQKIIIGKLIFHSVQHSGHLSCKYCHF